MAWISLSSSGTLGRCLSVGGAEARVSSLPYCGVPESQFLLSSNLLPLPLVEEVMVEMVSPPFVHSEGQGFVRPITNNLD